MLIDTGFLDKITEQAKSNPRLRMNFNLHDSPDSNAQRLCNALEPGTVLPVHRHVDTAETFILLRGKLTVTLYDNRKLAVEQYRLDCKAGKYGVQIPKNTWHSIDVGESGTVVFEVKDGPYLPLTPENILQ